MQVQLGFLDSQHCWDGTVTMGHHFLFYKFWRKLEVLLPQYKKWYYMSKCMLIPWNQQGSYLEKCHLCSLSFKPYCKFWYDFEACLIIGYFNDYYKQDIISPYMSIGPSQSSIDQLNTLMSGRLTAQKRHIFWLYDLRTHLWTSLTLQNKQMQRQEKN